MSRKYGTEKSSSAKVREVLYLGYLHHMFFLVKILYFENISLHKEVTIERTNRGINFTVGADIQIILIIMIRLSLIAI